ncbi:MAG TPA: hypothetical protein VNR38_15160 [Ureibacillus sp.]|nr:hypothetical protein [Ureibacillus sp.]
MFVKDLLSKKKVKSEQPKTTKEFDETLNIMGRLTAKIHSRAVVDTEQDVFHHESEEEFIQAIGDDFHSFCKQILLTSITNKDQVKQDYALFSEWANEEFSDKNSVLS